MDPIPSTTTIPPFVSKAGAPFDRPDADVVLRSEDGVDFRTFKAHLSSASEFLDHMFSSLQPPSADDEDERSEEHTSELQSLRHLVCRLLLEKKNATDPRPPSP